MYNTGLIQQYNTMFLVHNFPNSENHYRPQTKFGEGKVLTGVCLSGWRSRSLDRSHGRVPSPGYGIWIPYPLPDMGPEYSTPSSTTDICWSSLETCPNLFYLWTNPTPHWHLVVTTETRIRMVGKRVVRILLEYCLVLYKLHFLLIMHKWWYQV